MSSPERTCDYCVLTGTRLRCYESLTAYTRGDCPLNALTIVGASALPPNSLSATDDTSFRLMSNQGTHVFCQAPTLKCRDIWLSTLHAGLEIALLSTDVPFKQFPPPQPQRTLKRIRSTRVCTSCGAPDVGSSGGSGSGSTAKVLHLSAMPLQQYGKETRVDICSDCLIAQGLLDHLDATKDMLRSAQQERSVRERARELCWKTMSSTAEEAAADLSSSTESWTHVSSVGGGGESDDRSTPSPPELGGGTDVLSTSAATTAGSSWHVTVEDHPWVHLPPTAASTQALLDLLRDPTQFGPLATSSPYVGDLAKELLNGRIGVADFLEQLDEAVMKRDSVADLKKEAFRVAGDMGTAMKLLADSALKNRNTETMSCILDFFLDLCEERELSSVAFFWPQLCHVHLRMLPVENTEDLARVEIMEDFLMTVATRYSIHLALELVWSHTADLEESLNNPSCATSCRRRRYALLRFVCELESLLFDFDDGWGGGTVSLGRMLSPTGHQVESMKSFMAIIQNLRRTSPYRLSRSARLDALTVSKFDQPPEEAAREKLRIATNADYFTSHLNFTRRICDIAEKLRFLEQEKREDHLVEELDLLNSSGTMGGDPLNIVREHLVRVVRVSPTEGHVFRSKERTPVLLLLETVDEGADLEGVEVTDPRHGTSGSESMHDTSYPATTSGASSEGVESATVTEILPELIHREPFVSSSLHSDDFVPRMPDDPINILEGASTEVKPSPRPAALKRFDSSEFSLELPPTTPKHDVELLLNSVMEQQLKDIGLPDLTHPGSPSPLKIQTRNTSPPATPVGAVDLTVLENLQNPVKDAPQMKESPTKECLDRRGSKKLSTLGLGGSPGDGIDSDLAPTGDVRREVLNAIMMRGLQGNAIAAGAADSVQRSLQELERRRATELLMSDDEKDATAEFTNKAAYIELENTRQKLISLGIGSWSPHGTEEAPEAPSEEDEVMEAIRLLLIQNRVAQGKLSPADAAKVLQHNSISRSFSDGRLALSLSEDQEIDASEMPTVDAGDVDRRLVGCGPLPPAILQAITLWKGEMVSNSELLELVKKDLEFLRHSVLLEAENVEKLNENSDFWGRFAFGERWAEKKSRIGSTSPVGATPGWNLAGVIVKSNDDLRQEAFVMQLIELCQEAFELAGLELWVNPYRILATGRSTGIIECVRNAMSLDSLKKRPGYGKGGLREHLQRMTEFTANPGGAFKSAQQNFVRSLAAYSLMSYFFMFKDRHNGNILLDTAGHVIQIDFGFVFGIAPGGSFSLEMSTPFKLTEEMLEVMGGLKSPLFSEFVTLFCCGFLALQSYSGTFLTIVDIMCRDSTFKCFDGRDTDDLVAKLRERFCPNLSKAETVTFALDLIKQAITSYGTRQYDMFQYLSQGIAT